MNELQIKNFEKDLFSSLIKLKLNKNKNVYITSNLTKISRFRFSKEKTQFIL